MNTKHIIIVRKDLDLPTGAVSAQVSHIGDSFMRKKILDEKEFTNEEKEWMKTPYIAVLGVNNPEELIIIIKKAKDIGLQVHEWRDLIYSDVLREGIPDVLIGISIGPCDSDAGKEVTGNLKLL